MPANWVENEIIDRSSVLACKLNDDVIRGNTRWLGIKLFIRISRITRITRGREWMIAGKGMRLLENREITKTERKRERVKGRESDGSFNETFVNFWLPVELESSRALDIRRESWPQDIWTINRTENCVFLLLLTHVMRWRKFKLASWIKFDKRCY